MSKSRNSSIDEDDELGSGLSWVMCVFREGGGVDGRAKVSWHRYELKGEVKGDAGETKMWWFLAGSN